MSIIQEEEEEEEEEEHDDVNLPETDWVIWRLIYKIDDTSNCSNNSCEWEMRIHHH